MYLVGQKNNKELIDNGKLDNANFIMIKGPKHYGKTYLAKYIAEHYKLNYILLDNKVDSIRKLVESSDKNNECLYHLKDFDKSSPAAKAALLKIAEETPKGMKIVVTTSAYNILETLKSRAYIISMNNYSYDDILDYSDKLSFSNEIMERMKNYHLQITPSLLFKYKNVENLEEIFSIVDDTLNSIGNGIRLEDASRISNNFWKDDIERVTIYLEILCKLHLCVAVKNPYNLVKVVENTYYKLNKVSINNYKQLIHNMLMEMV